MPKAKVKTISDRRDEQRRGLEKIEDSLDDAKKELNRLWKLHEMEFGGEKTPYVDDGAFTDVGKKRLYDLLNEGRTNRELSNFFGVTDGAIAYHRKQKAAKAA
jgi:hypothetical protein